MSRTNRRCPFMRTGTDKKGKAIKNNLRKASSYPEILDDKQPSRECFICKKYNKTKGKK